MLTNDPNYPGELCRLGENDPGYLCLTSLEYHSLDIANGPWGSKENLGARDIGKEWGISPSLAARLIRAHPNLTPRQVLEQFGPPKGLKVLSFYFGRSRAAVRLMKPDWTYQEVKLYSEEQFQQCLTQIKADQAELVRRRQQASRKHQLIHRRSSKEVHRSQGID